MNFQRMPMALGVAFILSVGASGLACTSSTNDDSSNVRRDTKDEEDASASQAEEEGSSDAAVDLTTTVDGADSRSLEIGGGTEGGDSSQPDPEMTEAGSDSTDGPSSNSSLETSEVTSSEEQEIPSASSTPSTATEVTTEGQGGTSSGSGGGGTAGAQSETSGEGGSAGELIEDPGQDCALWHPSYYDVPFKLFFSEPNLELMPFDGDCIVDSITGSGPYLLGFTCDVQASNELLYPGVIIDLELVIGTPGALQVGSRVRFAHNFAQGFNTENYAYAIFATDSTAGYSDGDLLFGGLHADEWAYIAWVFDPMTVALSDERCATEPTLEEWDCVRRSYHDVAFTYRGETKLAPVSVRTSLGGTPELEVLVTSARVLETVEACCHDCEDDWVVFGIWPK